jgi:glycosyltransferase involved in cell wall biosynthesis
MRVAHFVQRYPPALGGSEAYFDRLSKFLSDKGDQVTVFTTNALDLEAFWSRRAECLPAGRQVEDGLEIRRYPLLRFPGRRYVLKALSFAPNRFWQCLTMPCNPIAWRMWTESNRPRQHFDLVHATAFPYAWPIACGMRMARRLGVPFLLTPFLHLGDPEDPQDRTRKEFTTLALMSLIQAADRVFVQTDLERKWLLGRGIDEKNLVLLGMGVEPRECTGGDQNAARQEWEVQEGEVVVGHLANNSREKGTIDLLLAADQLWRQGRRLRVILAGPEMANFRSFWNGRRASGPVVRLGRIDDSQKRNFFAGIDIFALPSCSDSFGLVLLESWANCIPNIAYRAGGVAEVVRHELDGLLVRCGDVAALATALDRLTSSPDLRQKLGTSGQERIRHEFCWEDKLSRVRQIYRESCSSADLSLSARVI